jgi:hypothetical protein
MKNVRLKKARPNYRRILRTKDLDARSVKHKGADLVWGPENNFSIEMTNQMSDSLVAAFPGEFVMSDADGDDESPTVQDVMTSLASGPQGSVPGSPDESLASSADDEGSSTAKASKNK